MSDLRDFSPSNDIIRSNPEYMTRTMVRDDVVEENSLGDFHVADEEEPGHGTAKTIGALAVVLLVGAASVYGYEVSTAPKPVVAATQTASNMPAPPRAPSAMTPAPAPSADASAPADNNAAQTASAPAAAAPEPARKPVRSARTEKSVTTIDGSQSAATAAPAVTQSAPDQTAVAQPVYPTAPSSALANADNNPNTQLNQSAPADAIQTPALTPSDNSQVAPSAVPAAPVPAPDQSQTQPAQPAQ